MIGIELEQGISILLERAKPLSGVETVGLLQGLGRVLAEDISAPFDNPPFDRSPLDGYAFNAASSVGATKDCPVAMNIVGEACAGQYYEGNIGAGEAIRIMTGARIPDGCDCVIRQEDTNVEGNRVWIHQELKPYQNYCFQGEDIKQGTVLMNKGEVLHHSHIGVLASMGYKEVSVRTQLRVGILSTGDEIVDVGQPLGRGKIYNSNLYTIASRLIELGAIPIVLGQAEDSGESVARVIQEHIDDVDLMITTGGVSVGIKDIMHEVLPILGAERLFWKVNMKPGTPVICGDYKEKLLICLSGNPFASIATFELIARPVMAKISGNEQMNYRYIEAVLMDEFKKSSPNRRFIRAKYSDGQVFLPGKNHSSGVLFTNLGCNSLIDISKGTSGLEKNQRVNVVVL